MSTLDLLQYLAASLAMGGSLLIALNGRSVRLVAFTMFITSSVVSVPVFYTMGMLPYVALQGFYISASLLGLYNTLKTSPNPNP